MTDALCGPSNAIQNFQKHSAVDRTLQQDRLISRQSPLQGFRSPGQNAGLLDPEFEAFQAGQIASPPPQFDTRPFLPQSASPFAPQQSSALPDWANDFQRLHIGAARPASSHHSPAPSLQHTPIVRQSPQASWHQDFMQSQQMNTIQQPPSMFQPQQAYPDYSWEYGQTAQFSPIAQGKQPMVEQQAAQFDAAAFDAAFDAATRDALAVEDAIAADIQAERDEIDFLVAKKEMEETANRQARAQTNHLSDLGRMEEEDGSWLDQEPIHEEQHVIDHEARLQDIEDTIQKDEEKMQPPIVDEELARTAGHLLESVSHDTSQKFQDSVFLQLMRRIRDKEVKVEGENFVETGSSTPMQAVPMRIPDYEQDLDLGRFDSEVEGAIEVEPDVIRLPSRPLTPEIDPPAPLFADWVRKLWE